MGIMASCESLGIFTIYLSFVCLDSGSSEYFSRFFLSLNIAHWTQSIEHDLNFYLFRCLFLLDKQRKHTTHFFAAYHHTFSYVYRLLLFILSRNLYELWKSLVACWLEVRLCVSWSLYFLSIGITAEICTLYTWSSFEDRSTSIIARSSLNFQMKQKFHSDKCSERTKAIGYSLGIRVFIFIGFKWFWGCEKFNFNFKSSMSVNMI